MKNLYCVICGKQRKFERHKISYIFQKKNKKNKKRTLVFLYYLHKCKNEDDKIFREEESNEILKILGLFKNI